jgi:DNA helicase II / ATP-dependent DNA helicase PcrA
MAWDDGLAGTARNIAATSNSPLRVMAGPGTGKSFAMKRRVARLLEGGQDARRILAVTFTRNAAASLVEDLRALGVQNCENVKASTLRALCFALLGKQNVFEYLGRNPRPVVTFTKSAVLQFEANAMLADLIVGNRFGGKRDCTKRIRAFEAAWSRLQSEQPGWPTDPTDRQFQAALIGWLKFHEAMLVGELVPEALRFLRNNPTSPDRSAFDHVIVDEYQDLNRAEQDLIQLLAGAGAVAIVGDEDQSIYRFRHANPEGIITYHTIHAGTHDEVLNECRRCPKKVVALADALIQNNHPAGGPARLRPLASNALGEVHIVQWDSIEAETQGLSDYIQSVVAAGRYLPKDILVLTPRRLLGYSLRDCIKDRGVPVHSFYHEEALEGEAAQKAFALLTLLVNDEDRVALRWWLGEGSGTRRSGAYKILRDYCEREGVSTKEALQGLADGQIVLAGTKALVTKFDELQVTLATLRKLGIQETIDAILPDGNEECAILREASRLSVDDFETSGDLFDYLRRHVTQPEMPEEGDFVRIMSLHKSKGLTSKVVIVVGCIQGLIPFDIADEPPAERALILQEQRRLFYVAITRCTEVLVLSSAARMARDFAWKIRARVLPGRSAQASAIASTFLDELGAGAPDAIRGEAWVY